MEMEKIHINSSKLSDVIEKFDKPTKIYIPLMDKNGNSYKMLVKVGDYVYKGDKVANCEKFDFPINSSVSGYVASMNVNVLLLKMTIRKKLEKIELLVIKRIIILKMILLMI